MGLVEDVLELRAYADAKRRYDRAVKAEQLEELDDDPAVNEVRKILYALLHEE